jgi:uncharacterized protein YbbC (DUF1343 family)
MAIDAVAVGCERLLETLPSWFRTRRLGLLCNQASVDRALVSVARRIREAGGRLTCLFAPQHGFDAEKQANMQESPHGWDEDLQLPVYSLYGDVRQPTAAMLETIDVLLIDLQDVGTRAYTYSTTTGLCLEAAHGSGIKVVVLDRPNPIGGEEVEGNVVAAGLRSFVGRYPLPMRHGLTLGELARFIVAAASLDCDLEVMTLTGWQRNALFPQTGLPWVFPSPNMPSWETAMLYPGMVLFEGTNVSEGRGTTLPFQLFGAPFVRCAELGRCLQEYALEGVRLRPVGFEPMFDKWRGELCRGFHIHITDPRRVRPYRLGLSLLQALLRTHGEHVAWLPPPYEYEAEKLPIDILVGNEAIRRGLEAGATPVELERCWQGELAEYRLAMAGCRLYPS